MTDGVWICCPKTCGCACGLCDGVGCDCECHWIDAATNSQVKSVLVNHGGYQWTDVMHQSRNQLFRLMSETPTGEPQWILEKCMKVMGQSMTEPLEPDDSELMEFVIDKRHGRTTPPPQPRKRSITPAIKKAGRICPSQRKAKSKSKSKAAAKEQRRLARCKP